MQLASPTSLLGWALCEMLWVPCPCLPDSHSASTFWQHPTASTATLLPMPRAGQKYPTGGTLGHDGWELKYLTFLLFGRETLQCSQSILSPRNSQPYWVPHIGFTSFPESFLSFPPVLLGNYLLNKLLALTSLFRGLLLGGIQVKTDSPQERFWVRTPQQIWSSNSDHGVTQSKWVRFNSPAAPWF